MAGPPAPRLLRNALRCATGPSGHSLIESIRRIQSSARRATRTARGAFRRCRPGVRPRAWSRRAHQQLRLWTGRERPVAPAVGRQREIAIVDAERDRLVGRQRDAKRLTAGAARGRPAATAARSRALSRLRPRADAPTRQTRDDARCVQRSRPAPVRRRFPGAAPGSSSSNCAAVARSTCGCFGSFFEAAR